MATPANGSVHAPASQLFDWAGILRRLEQARAALDQTWRPEAAEKRRILEERARLLAREITPETVEAGVEVVEFIIAQERYAFPAGQVSGVYALREVMPLPCTPPFLLGISNLHGEMLPVIDISRFFGLPGVGLDGAGTLAVLQVDDSRIGILADFIDGAHRIPQSAIHPGQVTLTGIRQEYLHGVTKEGVALLDAGRLLADERLVVSEQVE